jgi:GNAT superfamily N-acetyltransferase
MFVPSDLVACIEAAEAQLVWDILAATRGRRPALDSFGERLAGGCACYAGPGAPVNKIVGLGFGGLPDPEQLGAIERRFHERGGAVVAEVSSHADPALLAMLAERGYRLRGVENVLGIGLPAAAGRRSHAVATSVLAPGTAPQEWLDVMVEGFAVPDAQGVASQDDYPREVVREVMRDMAAIDGFRCHVARTGGQLAGGGALRTHGSVAHLCGAATLPAFRRRGVQTTLVTDRLAAAAAAGCEVAVTTTLPGSKSQQNMVAQGFCLLYVRAQLLLPVERSPSPTAATASM